MSEKNRNNNIEYTKIGDYYIPNLVLPKQEKYNLGKYGLLRLSYLKKHKKAEYQLFLVEGILQKHLIEIDKTAKNRVNNIIKQLAEKEGVTEELKAQNQLEWVRKMNSIKNRAEEVILNELIYV